VAFYAGLDQRRPDPTHGWGTHGHGRPRQWRHVGQPRQHRQRSSTSSYRVDSSFFIGKRQPSVNVNEDRQRSLLHNNSSLPPEQQIYRNVFATTIYRTNKKIGLRRLKKVTADGRYKHGLKAPPVRKSAIVYKISLVNKRLTASAFLKTGKNIKYKDPRIKFSTRVYIYIFTANRREE